MTNLEMNDVLSSIRKLVSGDRAEPKSEPSGLDRFVLTPAHRIGKTNEDREPLPDLSGQREDADAFELLNPAMPEAEDRPKENAETLSFLKDHTAEPAEPSGFAEPPVSFETSRRRTEEPAEPVEPDHSGPEEEHHVPLSFGAGISLEERIAELEEAVNRSEGDWEPDGSEPDAGKMPDRHLFEVIDNTQHWKPSEPPEDAVDATVEDDQDADDIVDYAFTHKLPEQLRSEKAPLQLAEVATFAHVPSKSDETELAEPPQAENELPQFRRPEIVDDDEDVFVDEDVLRRVVSEIVKEELQGKMGERITRNVRRMVRREIEQTLSLKGIE
ncbi:MAG: hypothetical protein ACSHXD_15555 [Marinosulfonomonas sp.]